MKAQISSEFMIVYAALLTIFLIIFIVYYDGSLNMFQAQDKGVALRNAQSVAAAINFVYLAGDGASYNFVMTNMDSKENITVSDFSVASERPHASAVTSILNAKVNESLLDTREITIVNNKGEIDIKK